MNKPDKVTIEVRDEELVTMLTVAICETALGFKRQVIGGGFIWHGVDVATGAKRKYTKVEELPPFAKSADLAIALFIKQATDRRLLPALWIDPFAYAGAEKTPVHCRIDAHVTDGVVKTLCTASAINVPRAICHAVCDLDERINLTRLHRDLFPGRYLVAVPS